jgi:hypothetical protein
VEAVSEETQEHPGQPVEVWATDEHRLGLKPVRRRVWAPIGERPLALGHHRYEWLYVTAFVQPTGGETVWYLSDGVSKPFFEKLLADFAETVGAGKQRRIILVLDNAGWHGEAGLAVPEGLRLVFLPPYTPELQPGRTPVAARRRIDRQYMLRNARRHRRRPRRSMPATQQRSIASRPEVSRELSAGRAV